MTALARITPYSLPAARRDEWLPYCVAALGVALNVGMVLVNREFWNVDFNQFYSAGKLIGTGHLYDWQAIRALESERLATAVPFGRFPVFALAFHPFSLLPYSIARLLWLCVAAAALAGFVALWPFPNRVWTAAAVCWSAPAAMCLALGQDSILFLFFVTLGLRLLLRGHGFWAGLSLSLCLAKPHLALALPVFLAASKQWRALLGGLFGVVVSAGLCFAFEGPQWPYRLLSLARLPEFDPAADRMPNLRGLLSSLGDIWPLELFLVLAVLFLVWRISSRLSVVSGCALALAGGLLVSHHAYFYDAVLLLPALLAPFERDDLEWLRNWAIVLLTPVCYLLLLTSQPWLAHFALTGFVLTLMTALSRRSPRYGIR